MAKLFLQDLKKNLIYSVWKIRGKVAKILMMTFAHRFL
jgi:hypothetical protein